ncbi:MAG: S8 family peptidase, partial [Candidatus Omnitrophota bacterium]|nr:S8 family peptidase [Candidatus Omnitrophota bacterium]
KGLHRKMRLQKKTEDQINKETFQKLSKKRKLAAKEPKNYRLQDVYILKGVDTESKTIKEICEDLKNDPNIEYAEPNYIVSICLTPNDPLYPIQWPLSNTGQAYPESGYYNPPPGTPDCDIDAPEAWDVSTGSPDIVVAVIDTGVDYTHRDINDNMWKNLAELNGVPAVDDDGNGYVDDIYGYDFCNYLKPRDSDPIDDAGHGTHVAGIIAAEGNNGLDITGICWNTKIMALKFLDSNGWGQVSDAVDAFYYAANNGARITSNSWGGGRYSQTAQDAINYAHDQGLVMMAAAGNDNLSSLQYPACYDNMIAVSATNSNDGKAPFSNYGTWIDVAAPGVHILSLRANGTSMGTIYDDYTTIASGTSMACPQASGLAALIYSFHPEFTNEQVRQVLRHTTDAPPAGTNQYIGTGRINALKALQLDRVSNATLSITFPRPDNPISGVIDIIGTATDDNFASYSLYYGKGDNVQWNGIYASTTKVSDGVLYSDFDTSALDDG